MRQGIKHKFFRIPQILKEPIDAIWIVSVYVKPENRGRGMATEMLERFLRKHKKRHILLEAHGFDGCPVSAKKLQEWYRAFGFKRIRGFGLGIMWLPPRY